MNISFDYNTEIMEYDEDEVYNVLKSFMYNYPNCDGLIQINLKDKMNHKKRNGKYQPTDKSD